MQLPPALRALLDRPEPARRLGPFALVRQLGRGGFAPVWLAREIYDGVELRRVAIKLFAFDALDDPQRARVIREAALLCKVEHPNIVRFLQLLVDEESEEPGVLGLVMEHIDGPSLEQRLRREGRLPLDEVLALGASVASALAAVHGAGLVHRDVKPANIIEARGVIKLIDFGVALPDGGAGAPAAGERLTMPDLGPEAAGAALSTLASSVVSASGTTPAPGRFPSGTVGYIDPACIAEGAAATPASDLYALGVTLFECLTGVLPSVAAAGTGGGLKGEVLDGRAPSPPVAELAPEAPRRLCRLVDALLSPAREARPASAEGVATELERLRLERRGGGVDLPEASLAEAQARYFDYLAAECSEIQLNGLPADQEVGARRLGLERLFVPLKLVSAPAADRSDPQNVLSPERPPPQQVHGRMPLGRVLADHPRLAVLGPPGAGKSTLLRSLAVAYAFPDRRPLLDADLPERAWLPLLIRCRELGELVLQPVPAILGAIPGRAFMDARLASPFSALVERALRDGRVLLLIDGLDEIAEEGRRTIFVASLRTFLAMYPAVSAVVTSREAGFRIIARALATECKVVTIADLDTADIQRLTVAWCREVLGDRPTVTADAQRLAYTIASNNRILLLAKNPLLLMTLLLVNRWLGQLPTKRVALYEKAIEVLLMSWNVEAYGKLDPEEVLPQLAYVAFRMMEQGVQRIAEPELRRLLQEAREQMPEILAYARLGVGDLIERVEYRSSLLTQTGKQIVDGRLVDLYELRHLTFQEHLAALAAVKRYYPAQAGATELVSLLRPHFREERWREVIPLAAVLAGRDARPMIETLIAECEAETPELDITGERGRLLWQCLVDEVQVPPPVLDRALDALLRTANHRLNWTPLARGRYGEALRCAVERLFHEPPVAFSVMLPLAVVTGERLGISWDTEGVDVQTKLLPLIDSGSALDRAGAAAAMGWLPLVQTPVGDSDQWVYGPRWKASIVPMIRKLFPMLASDLPALQYAACDALRRLGVESTGHDGVEVAIPRLSELWATSPWDKVRKVAGKAIWLLILRERPRAPHAGMSADVAAALDQAAEVLDVEQRLIAATLAYYHRWPWRDEELAGRLVELRGSLSTFFTEHLGMMIESLSTGRAAADAQAAEPARDPA